jgi:chromosome segregation protein
VESLTDAIRISRNSNDRYRIVTLDGQMIHAGGSMTGGSSAKGTGFLSRANELEKLRERRRELAKEEEAAAVSLEKLRTALTIVRNDLDIAMEDRNTLSARESSLNAESTAVENVRKQFQLLLDSISDNSEVRRKAVTDAEQQIENLKKQLEAKENLRAEITTAVAEIRREIDDISRSRLELEGRRTRTEKTTQERNAEILDLERQSARIEQKKLASDMEEKQILDKLWDNYELGYTAAQQLRQPVENLQRANREISDLRRQIAALGSPNIGAIEEYERVSERYGFLTSQRDDVEKAKRELLGIIRDVTGEMQKVFVDQFARISDAFRQTFRELFGGGNASLVLEDPDNILESGIDIKCQPPGKALSTISLMSGGEMAFLAIALYFAILKVRPTPFCVMDEIEAALDEANVNRFADYLRRMADRTQFIVITHRRGTMEEADMLYGVTMQEKGVSTVLELDFDQAQMHTQ